MYRGPQEMSFHFFAPIADDSHEIDYSYAKMPKELDLLQEANYSVFMHKQCLKIGKYLQKVRGVQVLQMEAQFVLDDNKNMWLSYASNIQI